MNADIAVGQRAVVGEKERLVSELKGVVVDVGNLLNDVTKSTAEEFAAGRTKFDVRLGAESSRLGNARIVVAAKASGAAEIVQEYLKENPSKVIAIVVVGIVIAFVLSHG